MISADLAVSHVSDLVAVLEGRTILSEFPELCGVEQSLIDHSIRKEVGDRFIQRMHDYTARKGGARGSKGIQPRGTLRTGC